MLFVCDDPPLDCLPTTLRPVEPAPEAARRWHGRRGCSNPHSVVEGTRRIVARFFVSPVPLGVVVIRSRDAPEPDGVSGGNNSNNRESCGVEEIVFVFF